MHIVGLDREVVREWPGGGPGVAGHIRDEVAPPQLLPAPPPPFLYSSCHDKPDKVVRWTGWQVVRWAGGQVSRWAGEQVGR